MKNSSPPPPPVGESPFLGQNTLASSDKDDVDDDQFREFEKKVPQSENEPWPADILANLNDETKSRPELSFVSKQPGLYITLSELNQNSHREKKSLWQIHKTATISKSLTCINSIQTFNNLFLCVSDSEKHKNKREETVSPPRESPHLSQNNRTSSNKGDTDDDQFREPEKEAVERENKPDPAAGLPTCSETPSNPEGSTAPEQPGLFTTLSELDSAHIQEKTNTLK